MTYRFFTPAPAKAATGLTAEVYRQLREDFLGPVPAFQALSAVPELLAATWALMRESLLAGDASRVDREIVVSAVSRANRCPFCVDAHVMLLHALGEHELAEAIAQGEMPSHPRHAELVGWAKASLSRGAAPWNSPCSPEITGTLLAFHFLNRIISAFLDPDLLPGGLRRFLSVRSGGGWLSAKAANAPKKPARSLSLVAAGTAQPPAWAGDSPVAAARPLAWAGDSPVAPGAAQPAAWAGESPVAAAQAAAWAGDSLVAAAQLPAWAGDSPVGVAYAMLKDAAGQGGALLSEVARQTVISTVIWESGRFPDEPGLWAADLIGHLSGKDRAGTRIALLAAFAPAAISPADVAVWRLSYPDDADLVRIVAFGAVTATDHIAQALTPAHL